MVVASPANLWSQWVYRLVEVPAYTHQRWVISLANPMHAHTSASKQAESLFKSRKCLIWFHIFIYLWNMKVQVQLASPSGKAEWPCQASQAIHQIDRNNQIQSHCNNCGAGDKVLLEVLFGIVETSTILEPTGKLKHDEICKRRSRMIQTLLYND